MLEMTSVHNSELIMRQKRYNFIFNDNKFYANRNKVTTNFYIFFTSYKNVHYNFYCVHKYIISIQLSLVKKSLIIPTSISVNICGTFLSTEFFLPVSI